MAIGLIAKGLGQARASKNLEFVRSGARNKCGGCGVGALCKPRPVAEQWCLVSRGLGTPHLDAYQCFVGWGLG